MVPPKLTVVPHRQEREDGHQDDDVMRELTHAPAQENVRGLPPNIAQLPSADRREQLRILEALLFAAAEPLAEAYLAGHLKSDDDVTALLEELQGFLRQPRHQPDARGRQVGVSHGRGSGLSAGAPRHRAAPSVQGGHGDAGHHRLPPAGDARRDRGNPRRGGLGRHHRRADGGELGAPARSPPRSGPADHLWHTDQFLEHFGFDGIKDLPGLAELKGSGLLSSNLPPDFTVPEPNDAMALMPDELPLDAGEEETGELPLGEGDDDRGPRGAA